MTAWADVLDEHRVNVGFVEGPNNANPWSAELGIPHVAYCAAAATRVAAHHGVDWGPDAQFPHKGIAYSPYVKTWGEARGLWRDDHPAAGVDLQPGDIVLYSWNHDTVADHTESVVMVYLDGTFDTVGYNTGSPEGCHSVHRDHKYLLGRVRAVGTIYQLPAPPAPTTPGEAIAMGYIAAVMPPVNPGPHADGRWVFAAVTPEGRVDIWNDSPGLFQRSPRFKGDTRSFALAAPIVDFAWTPSGEGYWLAAADGGLFAYGDAPMFANPDGAISAAVYAKQLAGPVIGFQVLYNGTTVTGYCFLAADGGVFTFGSGHP